ncbi:hypothetical protein D9758_017340 [Tetrapyrgos nigripes]|uniref:Retrotransposon gag domain-containing protein n=1 Tax=Tetrapyrgos nigripes TaxID=182062 RepID=A0A8H5FIE3_9AGAR|nr:hypothetical protein D9758_017340 [Tetrapyrgos nigripes]
MDTTPKGDLTSTILSSSSHYSYVPTSGGPLDYSMGTTPNPMAFGGIPTQNPSDGVGGSMLIHHPLTKPIITLRDITPRPTMFLEKTIISYSSRPLLDSRIIRWNFCKNFGICDRLGPMKGMVVAALVLNRNLSMGLPMWLTLFFCSETLANLLMMLLESWREEGNNKSYMDLCSAIQREFAGGDQTDITQRKLQSIKQGTALVTQFFLSFKEWKEDAKLNEEGLIMLLKQNLWFGIVQRIYQMDPVPVTYAAWKAAAVQLNLCDQSV